MSGPLISSREVTWELVPADPGSDINMDWPGIKHIYIYIFILWYSLLGLKPEGNVIQ